MKKACKHCYTEIHPKARICPECCRPQTPLGAANGFLITLFPMLAAIVSFVVAGAERIEKMNVSSQLAVVSTDLMLEEARSEAATQVVEQLAAEVPMESLEQNYRDTFDEEPTSEKLDEIEQRLQSDKKKQTMNREERINLEHRKLFLRKMRSGGGKKKSTTPNVSLRRRPGTVR